MKKLVTGEFYGETSKTLNFSGITVTDTVYTHDRVDWHYHENPYFTFLLCGNLIEGSKKETYTCSAGSLLFHNRQEPHYNIKPPGFARGFHIEIQSSWLNEAGITYSPEGSFTVANPDVKFLMYKAFHASTLHDADTELQMYALLTEIFSVMACQPAKGFPKPHWAAAAKEILHDSIHEKITLQYLSATLGIHPVHLCRGFSKYFNCTPGEYLRKLRVEKALTLVSKGSLSLTEIAYECGFTDQSHLTRCFRMYTGLKPSDYKKVLFTGKC